MVIGCGCPIFVIFIIWFLYVVGSITSSVCFLVLDICALFSFWKPRVRIYYLDSRHFLQTVLFGGICHSHVRLCMVTNVLLVSVNKQEMVHADTQRGIQKTTALTPGKTLACKLQHKRRFTCLCTKQLVSTKLAIIKAWKFWPFCDDCILNMWCITTNPVCDVWWNCLICLK